MQLVTRRAACLVILATSPLTFARQTAPLSGPRVEPASTTSETRPAMDMQSAAPTLIQRDFDGQLIELDRRPEVEALDLLHLTPDELAPITKLLDIRYTRVSTFTQEHYKEFLELQAARQAGQGPAAMREAVLALREAAGDLADPPLSEQVADLLPKAKAPDYLHAVREYIQAQVTERAAKEAGPADKSATRNARGMPAMSLDRSTPPRAEMQLFLREMGRSFKANIDARKERLEAFIKAVDATPEQEAKLRQLARDAAEKSRDAQANTPDSPARSDGLTQAQRLELRRKMLDVLTPEQRTKAVAFQQGR